MKQRLSSLIVSLAVLLGAAALITPDAMANSGTTVTVMTHNLYFGTDLTPVIEAQTQDQFLGAVATAFNEAQASDFAARAHAWADEIALFRPDLVGLNEAVQWRTGPFDGSPTADATTDAGNFVSLLLGALAARGLHYQLASESTGYDVEAPGAFASGLMDVRLTQHEAILARTDAGLTLSNPQSGQFHAMISLPTAVGSFPLPWSWASVDVTKNGRTFRFATTHLDPNDGAAQAAQAREFLSGPASTSLPMIWVGDLNSDADAAAVNGVVPDTETYGDVINAGFTDTWAATRPGNAGYTCCEAENLFNVAPTLNQRIDYILTRGSIDPIGDALVGNTVAERLVFGRWPSDHAGVVAAVEVR